MTRNLHSEKHKLQHQPRFRNGYFCVERSERAVFAPWFTEADNKHLFNCDVQRDCDCNETVMQSLRRALCIQYISLYIFLLGMVAIQRDVLTSVRLRVQLHPMFMQVAPS